MALLVVLLWMTVFTGLLAKPLLFREAAIAALTAVGVTLLIITEALSFFGALSFVPLTLSWVAVLLLSCALLWNDLPVGYERLTARWEARPRRTDALLLTTVIVLAAGSLARALLYPPGNWDSLTYHLPRVFFWLQNGSVAHYPTAEARQLFSSPFANYAVLHIQAMTGGSDRFVGLAQWVAYVFMLVAVSLIAQRLGSGVRGQWFAALTAATIPMAVLQAATTQNDLMCATWCLIAAYGVLVLVSNDLTDAQGPTSNDAWTILTACAAGLAFLTKPTAALALAPFAAWLLVTLIRPGGMSRLLRIVALAVTCVLLLSLPWFARNAGTLNGDILGLSAPGNTHILTAARSPQGLASNFLMNASMLVALPLDSANEPIERMVEGAAGLIGVSKLESVMGEPDYGPYVMRHKIWDHDVAPAPITVALLVLSSAGLVLRRIDTSRVIKAYLVVSTAGLVLTLTALGWQPWVNRLLLPSLVMLSPLVGLALDKAREANRRLFAAALTSVLALSVLLGTLVMLFHSSYELAPMPESVWDTPYDELRYRAIPDLAPALRSIREYVEASGVEQVGIHQLQSDIPSYLLLTSLRDIRVFYVGTIVLPERFTAKRNPEVVIGLMRDEQYAGYRDAVAAEGRRILVPPQSSRGVTVLLTSE